MNLVTDKTVEELFAEDAPKLTDWENEPTVADLKQDYMAAQSSHDCQEQKISTWLDNLNVEGAARIPKVKGRSTIVPKLIRKQAEWRYPSLSEPFLSQPNLFKTSPKTHLDKTAAYQNGVILNYQFNTQINKEEFIGNYVRTAVDEGTVIVRVGWESEEEEQEVEVPVMKVRPVTDPIRVGEMLQNGEPPVEEVQIGTEIELQMISVKNQPSLEICNYKNLTIDPTCEGSLEKANFVIFSFETSMSDLKKAGIYQNLEFIDETNESVLSTPDHDTKDESSFKFNDKPRKKFPAFEYWGYWDIENSGKTRPFVATWVGNTMIRMEESPFPDKKLPFVSVQYLPVRFSVYGEPDGELLEDNQKVLGAVTRGMVDIMGRSAAGQKGMRQDALDITNKRKFEIGEDYSFQAHVTDPRTIAYDHVYPEIPQSAQFMVSMQQQEAESLTGVKAFSEGLTGDAFGATATGAKGALGASAKREMDILRRLAKGLKDIGYKILAMNGEFLSDEEIIPITDEEFIEINRNNLVGQFDVELEISSAEMDNMKAQELAFMLQTMGNSMPPDMSQIILADIARLRKMPALAKSIEEYQPQPDPMQQQIQQLELQKLQAEIAKLQSETQENMANAQLDIAKAKEANSKADMLNLDFVEQETGTKQERDLQKQGEQARSNTLMKDREAMHKDRNTLLQALTKPQPQPSTRN